jgi:hypothetical protein
MRAAGRLVEMRGAYRVYECFIDGSFAKARGGGACPGRDHRQPACRGACLDLKIAEVLAGQAIHLAEQVGAANGQRVQGLSAAGGGADQVGLLAKPGERASEPARGFVGGEQFRG